MKRYSTFLTEYQIAELQAWAAASGLKQAELLRRIIDRGLADYHASQSRREEAMHGRDRQDTGIISQT